MGVCTRAQLRMRCPYLCGNDRVIGDVVHKLVLLVAYVVNLGTSLHPLEIELTLELVLEREPAVV